MLCHFWGMRNGRKFRFHPTITHVTTCSLMLPDTIYISNFIIPTAWKKVKLKKKNNFKTNWKPLSLILIHFFFIGYQYVQPKMISMILMIEWVSYQLPTEERKALTSNLPNSSPAWPWSQSLSFLMSYQQMRWLNLHGWF